MSQLRVLAVGDVVGAPGMTAATELIPSLREELQLDMVVVNGENAAGGVGITERQAKQLLNNGADVITLGNHALRQREIFGFLDSSDRIIRPATMPRGAPGRGYTVVSISTASGPVEVAVVNLMGTLYVDAWGSPFAAIDGVLDELAGRTRHVLVDMHAEATSEKVAMGHYLDGRVSAVWGTHTHVQTSDARVLPKGTAYITDLGMTGPHDSVIGVRAEIVIKRFTTAIGGRFETARGGVQLEGAQIELDGLSGKASSISGVRVPYQAS